MQISTISKRLKKKKKYLMLCDHDVVVEVEAGDVASHDQKRRVVPHHAKD